MKALRLLIFMFLAAAVSACANTKSYETAQLPTGPADKKVKIGNPYVIEGVTYYPREDPYYDVTGLASWYGPDFHGKLTANGEVYDMNALTAAHQTLPMPSYVRVTNLENGRSLVLRVNDRGPFVKSRILDVSRRAAQLLGFADKGVEKVRVQVVNPDGTPIPRPVDGGLTPVPQRTAANEFEAETLAPLPGDTQDEDALDLNLAQAEKVEAPNETASIFVQVASFSSEQNAASFAGYLSDLGPTDIAKALVNDSWFYRVRLGAFATMDEALAMLGKVKNLGFSDARIFTQP